MRSTDVATLAGVTYRQLDCLTRHPQTPLPAHLNRGPGNYRQWTPHQAICIALANHLTQALPHTNESQSPLPTITNHLLETPHIPPTGWLTYTPNTATIHEHPNDLIHHLHTHGPALVTHYNLHTLLTGRLPDDTTHHDGHRYTLHQLIHEATTPRTPVP